MAVYPPPLVPSPIFNSALFTSSTTSIVSSGDPSPSGPYVDFPNPQGALTFSQGTGDVTTIGADEISVFQNVGISADGVAFSAVGIEYTPPSETPVSITWDNLATKVEAIGAITGATDATTLNINNTISIQNGETIDNPTQYIEISSDATGNRIALDGVYGTAGQVLTSGGSAGSLSWADGGGGGTQDIQSVLDEGNTATDIAILFNQTANAAINSGMNSQSIALNSNNLTSTNQRSLTLNTAEVEMLNYPAAQETAQTIIDTTQFKLKFTAGRIDPKPSPEAIYGLNKMSLDDGALNNDNKTIEVEPTGITMSQFDNSVLTNEIIMDNEGFSVENITTGKVAYINLTAGLSLPPSSAITLENTAGTNGYVITSNGTTASWQPAGGGGGWVGTAESDLNMDIYAITSNAGTLNLTATDIDITGQATFNSPPHVPEPVLGNDAASKGYVDSLVGQYSGGFNLFMNYSNTAPAPNADFKELSPLVDSAAQQTFPVSLTTNSPFLLSQFITEPLGITEIPIGLWDLFLYALVNTQANTTTSYFELWKRPPTGADVLLGTSGTSGDINNTNTPTSYSMILTISTAIPLQLSDRVYIKIYGQTTHNNTVILTTYYEGNDYSFVQTTLNSGTTLLSSNNNWTGTNNFVLNPTTPSKTTPANTDIINYADIQRLSTPIVSTLDFYLTTDSPFFQYPPAPPTNTLLQTYQYYGWYFINSAIGRKIDWYFAPDYAMTVADVKGLYMNYFNITTTTNDNLPFISIYTKPTGTNDVIPGFAHSVNTFVPTFTPIAATPFCSFMNISGTQQDPFPYGHILGAMAQSTVNNPRGEYLSTEEVLAVAVGTASGSALNQVAFIMSKVGICLEQGNQELILNPQNIIVPPNLTQTLTSGNAAGGLSITGVNNLAATSVTTPTLANGAATLTVGTVGQITNIVGTLQNNGAELPAYISSSGVASGSIDMNSNSITECNSLDSVSSLTLGGTAALGTTLGRSTQTTNLVGNVQINGSSGASGEALISTGATTAPTWQPIPSANITFFQSFATTAISMGGVTNIGLPLTFNVPTSTATYLFTCSTSVGPNGSSGAGTQLLFSFAYQVGGGPQTTASRNVIGNNLYTTSLTSATSITQQVVPTGAGINSCVSFQYIYRPGSGTGFAVGSYTFGITVTNAGSGGPLSRSGTITATQLTA